MATSVRTAILCCSGALWSVAAQAQCCAPPAYRAAAQATRIPANVLFAVAIQESGIAFRGRFVPWPWTLNVAGTPHRYANRVQACLALLQALRSTPAKRVDVGLAEVNVGFHGHRVAEPCDLLDPYRNLFIAGTLIGELREPGDDWLTAVGRYHRPAGGPPAELYKRGVSRRLTKLIGATAAADTLSGSDP